MDHATRTKEHDAYLRLQLLGALGDGQYFEESLAEAGWYSCTVQSVVRNTPPITLDTPSSGGKATTSRNQSTAERLAQLDVFADQLISSDTPVADRLIHLRHKADDLGLNVRDTDLQRRLWSARRRHSGAVTMFTPDMEDNGQEEAWAWEGILMAGDSNLLAAQAKVGKTTILIDAIARWYRGEQDHLGRSFVGPCPRVIIAGTDMPRRRWLALLRRFGLAVGGRLLPDGPIIGLFSTESPIYLDSDGINTFAELAQKHPGCLLIVDSYAKCTAPLGLKESSSDYAGPLGDLQEAVATYGTTLVVVHHSGHSRAGEGAVAACRGTTALPAAVSQVVALSWLNRAKGSTDKRIILQTEGRGGEPLQLLIEQQDTGFFSHGDAADAFREQQLAEAEETLQDRQAAALELVRERWENGQQRTSSGDVMEGLQLKGPNAPRIARRTLQQLAHRGLLDSSKESTPHGAVVWFWPVGEQSSVPSSGSLSSMSPLSPLSPPQTQTETEKSNIAGARGEGTLRTHRTGGTDNRERGHPVSSPPPSALTPGDPVEVLRGGQWVNGATVLSVHRRPDREPLAMLQLADGTTDAIPLADVRPCAA